MTSSAKSTRWPRPPSSRCCSPPTPATASWPKNRAANTARRTASSSGSSTRWTAPPTSCTAFRSTPSASRGRGAFLNDKRLRVSKRTRLADSLVGTGFPFRKGDNAQRYIKMFDTVMQACAGVRRPGAAALDLCYVAAGWYDGFFETGLSPWDIAAGSLMITEAGGLVGNFTGDADFLYQREVVAGNPKAYGQLVTLLAPYSRAIKGDEGHDGHPPVGVHVAAPAEVPTATDALAAAVAADAVAPITPADAGEPAEAAKAGEPAARERKPVRIRKLDAPQSEGFGSDRPRGPRPDMGDRPRGPRPEGDRPRATGKPAPGRPLPTKR